MKSRHEFLLDESTLEYLEKYKEEHHMRTLVAAFTDIVEEREHRNDIPATKILMEGIAKQVADELSDTLTRIRLGANNADRNSDIIVMLLNTLIASQGFGTFFEDDTPQLVKAREKEKERIAHFRQRKLDREKADKKNQDEVSSNVDPADQNVILSEDEIIL